MGMAFLKFLIFIIVMFFCVVLHGFIESYVALLNGDTTARQAKRLSLNPVRHFDFVGFLLMLACRVGYSKPIPINSYYFKNKKVGVLTVPLSGLFTYLLISFIATPLMLISESYIAPAISSTVAGERGAELIYTIFQSMFTAGISLFLFNLIPINPMDGYMLVEGIFGSTHSFTRFLRDYAKYVFLSVIITFYVAYLFRLPDFLNPAYWYIEVLGGFIKKLFLIIWLPLF